MRTASASVGVRVSPHTGRVMALRGFTLRLHPRLHERLVAGAAARGVSLNAEITRRLNDSFAEHPLDRLGLRPHPRP